MKLFLRVTFWFNKPLALFLTDFWHKNLQRPLHLANTGIDLVMGSSHFKHSMFWTGLANHNHCICLNLYLCICYGFFRDKEASFMHNFFNHIFFFGQIIPLVFGENTLTKKSNSNNVNHNFLITALTCETSFLKPWGQLRLLMLLKIKRNICLFAFAFCWFLAVTFLFSQVFIHLKLIAYVVLLHA